MRYVVALLCGVAPAALAQPAGGFKHVLIVVQENRTPDNIFGSNPNFEAGVDIASSGQNSKGQTIPLTAERIDSCYDVKHQHLEFVQMYANGRMNGADLEQLSGGHGSKCHLPPNAQFKFADNTTGTVQPYFDLAKQYGFANRMFQTNQGPSYPSHQFLFGGTSAPTATSSLFVADNLQYRNIGAGCQVKSKQRVSVIDQYGSETSNPPVYTCFDRPTMADLLDAHGLSWTYYLNTDGKQQGQTSIWNAPASIQKICGANGHGHGADCKGAEYASHVEGKQAQILKDIQACKLPAVSWVIPNGSDSDHAGITGPTGPAWVASIVNAVGTQPACAGGESYWKDTAILITWDDWGGWYGLGLGRRLHLRLPGAAPGCFGLYAAGLRG